MEGSRRGAGSISSATVHANGATNQQWLTNKCIIHIQIVTPLMFGKKYEPSASS